MNTPASAVVPSREAVEIQRFKNRVDKDGDHLTRDDINGDWVDYADHEKIVNALLAEVERLNTHAERLSRINREVLAESELLSATVADQAAALAGKQARIDALMLEYCPKDMTPEQLEEWGRNQQPIPKERQEAIDAILTSEKQK